MGKICQSTVLLTAWFNTSTGQFLEDAAIHLSGSNKNAAETYTAYKHRTSTQDPKLPYPPTKPSIDIPETREELWTLVGLDKEKFEHPPTHRWQMSQSGNWMIRRIPNSKVKGKPRIIYRSRNSSGLEGLSIVETEETDPALAPVRETEMAIKRQNSKDWDFFAYGSDGKLDAASLFYTRSGKTIKGPAPVSCLACHYNRRTRLFTNIPASYLVAEKFNSVGADSSNRP